MDSLHLGVLTVSDRAKEGVYKDLSGPAIIDWVKKSLQNLVKVDYILVNDEEKNIANALVNLCDKKNCALVLTTGGTGPAKRDVTPEATLSVATKVLDGFGEKMRSISLKYVPTAILSRQVGVIRNNSLIINLPGRPKAIGEILDELVLAIPYCIDLIGGPYLILNQDLGKAYRPNNNNNN
ncbi:MAG: molybdopterin adenylyltransferase [SAR324 cluster bacterium]|nr:molybdopterin adenylyltransferase [SAR324 cluster bacterium]